MRFRMSSDTSYVNYQSGERQRQKGSLTHLSTQNACCRRYFAPLYHTGRGVCFGKLFKTAYLPDLET